MSRDSVSKNDIDHMKTIIARMNDPTGLRQFMKNALLKQSSDLHWIAFERLCEVLGRNANDPMDAIVWRLEQSVCAFEQLRNGRRASRTRNMIKSRGSLGTIKQWLTYDRPRDGYITLVGAGRWHLLGEAIPLDFSDRFTNREMLVADYRISKAKVGEVAEPFLPMPGTAALFL
jgi:hypothetical protein